MPLTSLVGRDGDRNELVSLLQGSRLVTLTGEGGIGKTRLAVEVATSVEAAQAVAFADLAAVSKSTGVDRAVACAMGAGEDVSAPGGDRSGRSLREAVAERVGERGVLLVLDNCEHVVGRCAEVAGDLLRACPGLRVLATSRERLGVAGEVVWRVAPLSLPHRQPPVLPEALMDSEAVQLFCERAAAVARGFIPTPANVDAVVEICRRLDGVPLAIELAAAHADVLTPAEIAAGLRDRFELLQRGHRAGPARHRTLLAAVQCSEDLLAPPERLLLARLSVFVGGFDVDAARQLCAGDGIERNALSRVLAALADKSLLLADTTGDTARYQLGETIRAYAAALLGPAERARLSGRHAAWLVGLVEEDSSVRGAQEAWVERLESEQGNLRAALEWALAEERGELALRLVGGQMRVWERRGHYREAREGLERVLAATRGDDVSAGLRAAALHDAGFATMMLGDVDAARDQLHASLALWEEDGDASGGARTRGLLGLVCTFAEDSLRVEDLEDDLGRLRATSDPACLAESLLACGHARMVRGEPARARAHFEEALRTARLADHDPLVVTGLVGAGSAALEQGDYETAQAHLHDSVAVAAALGDTHSQLVASIRLAELAWRRGELDVARARFGRCLEKARGLGSPDPLIRSLLGLGRVLLGQGDAHGAQPLLDEATAVAFDAGPVHLAAAALTAQARAAWDLANLARARELLDEALTVARGCEHRGATAACLHLLGVLARGDADLEQATSLHYETLSLREDAGDQAGVADSLEALAGVALARGCDETAARLFGAGQARREAGGYIRDGSHGASYERDIALLGQRLSGDEFDAAWREGAGLSAKQAMSQALKGRDRRTRPAEGWDALTRAERGVVALAADGLTNAEIAEHLFVSAETVKTHLSNAYPKLGISSRRQLRAIVQDEAR